jgi:cytochrome c peroxidase
MTLKQAVPIVLTLIIIGSCNSTTESKSGLKPIEELGKRLFFDISLSDPPGQSCASCHSPETGFTGPDSEINSHGAVYAGAVNTRFGNRKPSSISYGGQSPILYFDEKEKKWTGGMFWDGRAHGGKLDDPLAEQAGFPFLNPLEHNLTNETMVYRMVKNSDYSELFEQVWGKNSLQESDVNITFERIIRSIAAYERSAEVNPFTSKFDYFTKGQATFTPQEMLGLALFDGKGKCSVCHPSQPDSQGNPPLFTNFTYDNLGFPPNPKNPFYTMPTKFNPDKDKWIDYGLGDFLKTMGHDESIYQTEMGKFKVPTLRNVDKRPFENFVKAYGHNGYFKSLHEIVRFYNTRDIDNWPSPEVSKNLNTNDMGDLGLTTEEEDALVAFMKTLTDGFVPNK